MSACRAATKSSLLSAAAAPSAAQLTQLVSEAQTQGGKREQLLERFAKVCTLA